jgi:hypothetical protein
MYWAWQTANDVLIEAVDLLQHPNKFSERDIFLRTDPLIRANFRKVSEKACDAGTIAHEKVETYINLMGSGKEGFFDRLTLKDILFEYRVSRDVGVAALNSIKAFQQWTEQTQFNLYRTEVPLTSKVHLFGGTLDCIATVFNRQQHNKILFDWKTSGAVYAEYLCQIAAYKLLWEENNPTEPITDCHLLRFDKVTGDFTHHQFTDLKDATECFLLFRRCYDLIKGLNKRV